MSPKIVEGVCDIVANAVGAVEVWVESCKDVPETIVNPVWVVIFVVCIVDDDNKADGTVGSIRKYKKIDFKEIAM